MNFFGGTVNTRVYKCQSCAWEGKKPEKEYKGHAKEQRKCPVCGGYVKRLCTERMRKEEVDV